MNIIRFATLALVFPLVPSFAWSAQIDLAPVKDNTIFSESSNLSAGGQLGVFVGSNNISGFPPRRGLMQFDVAGGVPAGVTITAATLTLTLEMGGNTSSPTIEFHSLNADWGEGTAGSGGLSGGGSTAATGDATWTESKHSQTTWAAGGDFAAAVSASQTVSGNTAGTSFSWSSAGLLTDVKNWYANGASNHGWELINLSEGSQQTVKVFYSKEYTADLSRVPKLTITFVPEPSTTFLAFLSGPFWLAYRRR